MKPGILPATLALTTAASITTVWSMPKEKPISFWDAVRHPEKLADSKEIDKDIAEKAAALSGSPDNISKLIDFFVFKAKSADSAHTERQVLAKLGQKAYPRALEILRDPTTRGRLTVSVKTKNSESEAPIVRLCEIFDQDTPPPPEMAPLLASFLDSDNEDIRQEIALIIGSVGSAESIPALRKALKDEEEYVRSYALMGIGRAISRSRIKPPNTAEVFDVVSGMWPEDTEFEVCDGIPSVLLRLDRKRGAERLLEENLFTVKFEPVWRILEAFNKESVEIPRTKLLSLIAEASNEPLDYPMDNILEEALAHLGRYRNESDLPMLEKMLDHSSEDVSNGAVRGLYAFHRYLEEIRDPWDVVKASGWDALTKAEKHVCAVERLNSEVLNGGFAQYYFNPSGDYWSDALDGLKAIGAVVHHQLMAATVAKFTGSKPSAEHDARRSELSKIAREKEDPFHDQDDAWYECEGGNLERLIFKYNFANRKGREKVKPAGNAAPSVSPDPK